jgi:aryl-alcohol dehydrogenase-like predicted oxidoreductase
MSASEAGTLERRPLGRSGATISAIGLGGGNWGREIDEESSYRVMDYAFEKGITFFDTGDSYGGKQSWESRKAAYGTTDQRETTLEMYSSEKIIGRWMRSRGCRDQIEICTKVGTGGSPENIHQVVEGSLERLGVDRLDIFKLHSTYPDVPLDETLHAMDEEVRAGRVGVIGCSNHTGADMRAALDMSAANGWARFEITQPPYSLADPKAEADLLPLCQREGVAVTPYSPLAAGFLTGKYGRDPSTWPQGSRYHIMPAHADVYFSDRNFRIVELLKEKGEELGISSVKLAMAWVMTHPAITSALIGARHSGQVDNALEALRMGLDPELRAEMSSWTTGPMP